MNSRINILSYNVASSNDLAGLSQLLTIFEPHIVFIQEITLNSTQLLTISGNSYTGEVNLDPNDHNKPGTAILWLKHLKGEVFNLISCRIQGLKIMGMHFLNIYGFPGTQGQRGRKILFGEDLLNYVIAYKHNLPILIGDFNCVIHPNDVSSKIYGPVPIRPQIPGNRSHYFQKKSKELHSIVTGFNYVDGFSQGNGNKRELAVDKFSGETNCW